jgi:lipopolysaccharide transport system ATP-binding protein
MSDIVLKVEDLYKQYRLGVINSLSLNQDINRWWAKIRGKEDPYAKIGTQNQLDNASGEFVWALQDINFEVKRGEVLGIIGKNGAGKSTLLKILSKVTSPTKGNIKIKGRIASLLEVGTGFHPELTGRENIFLNGAILGMSKLETSKKLDEIIDFAGIAKYIDTPVKRYSSGMYTRLAFAVAAHLEPEILIVDEVLAVGDIEFQKKCLGKMKDVAGHGRTVLFVSHNTDQMLSLCNTGLYLQNGTNKAQGSIKDIVNTYLNEFIAEEVSLNHPIVKKVSITGTTDKIELVLEYSGSELIDIPNLGFVIADFSGNPIFGTNYIEDNRLNLDSLTKQPTYEGIIKVAIANPKLIPGIYRLSVWFGDSHTNYFSKADLMAFEIYEESSELSGKRLRGYIIPECNWVVSTVAQKPVIG